MDESNLAFTEPVAPNNHFSREESADYFKKLRLHYVSYLVYPRLFMNNPNFQLKIGQVPPVMDPLLSGSKLFDTEREANYFSFNCSYTAINLQKNSHVLKNKNLLLGCQQSLMKLLKSGELKFAELNEYSNEQLNQLCRKLKFSTLSK